MSWTGRNNNCWRANTPEEVGPGAYQLLQSRPIRTSTAPFDSAEPRLSSSSSQSSPGYYLSHKAWGAKCKGITSFGSKAVRLDGRNRKNSSPGPGSYEVSTKKYVRISGEKHVPIQVEVAKTAPSIPTKEIKPFNLGPGSYQPTYQVVQRGTAFGAYVAKREVFENTGEKLIGPGQYSVEPSSNAKSNWMFSSASKKINNEKLVKNEAPGPGSYEVVLNKSLTANVCAGFGSNTKRDIPMSADPYRPFVSETSKTPPVGNYLSKEEQEKIEKLKKKLITADYPVEKAPFNTSGKRTGEEVNKNPGPGAYQPIIDSKAKGLFPNKSPRFGKPQSITPGPGSYKLNELGSKGQKFTSKSPRFKKEGQKEENHEFYTRHTIWGIKQTRSPEYFFIDKTLSFDSTGQRFQYQNIPGPGPGQYEVRIQSANNNSVRISGNRSENYGDYRPKTGTTREIGPGAYNIDKEQRKTFNMAKELGKNSVWL